MQEGTGMVAFTELQGYLFASSPLLWLQSPEDRVISETKTHNLVPKAGCHNKRWKGVCMHTF